ncbi:hypothetical protein FHX76_000232 [Lysinibacter cavernae]|uniref:UPF0182 protein FHX76_000232 n=1 Tax=Lysinibacter cavernae TaxID=1640652 RepID=A0A7X5QYJ3_9MICO|nr:UPF0182 family protein [Lysinibacter cavernae]NIH52364.1 hypothetical protein [Lysinibacter cavernae]
MTTADASRPETTRKRRSPLALTAVIVGVLIVAFLALSGVFADVLWFQQLGFFNVMATQWVASIGLFLVGFFAMAIPVYLAIELSYRKRPVYAKLNAQLDRYQEVIEPLRKLASFGIPIVFGIFAGLSSATRWETVLTWINRTPMGTTDPQFGLDVSFYIFELPFYRGVVAFASAVILICLIVSVATSYLYGGISLTGRDFRVSKSARIQVAVLAAIYLLLQGVSFWLDQFATLTGSSGLITGAGYTEVHATIPSKAIMAGIAVLVAILFIVTAVNGRWRLPIVGTALLIVSSLVIGNLYPWIVQRFQVQPSEKSLEEPYIQRNIDSTRDAYGLANVEVEPYDAITTAEPGALRNDAVTTANIRIIDPSVVSPTVRQLEQIKPYYQFSDRLDVDRYEIDGAVQDAVVGVREVNVANQEGWYNQTLVYTHGYGLVAAYGNQRSADGLPVFMESGIPTSGKLGEFQPRVYFGENSPSYSIVGGSGDKDIEMDYPAGEDGESQTRTTFDGDGGPKLDNFFKRLVYALKFQSEQIVLSEAVTDDSQILYDRDPLTRVQKAAPYLTLDSDPYSSVVDGKLVWIVDGYTTSANYPYSKIEGLSDLIADSDTSRRALAFDDINYIRNSVKATVDAYDGSVTLYQWDKEDPILQTWMKVFPDSIKPVSEMSADLLAHVRYPADLFKVQRAVLGEYHVTDAGAFYSQEDAWRTPNDPVSKSSEDVLQPPYYLTLSPGKDADPTYSIYSTYIPLATGSTTRNVLTGYLTADSNAGSEKGKVADSYGTLKLLTLPKGDTIPGPGQVQNNFTTDNQVSQVLNILSNGGQTTVINGNLLTLPVGGGLLYVQPVYVKSQAETSYPVLQKVLVAFGDKIAFEDTLDQALDKLFGGDSGASAGDTDVPGNGDTETPTETPTDTPTDGATPAPTTPSDSGSSGDSALDTALKDMQQAITDRDAARAKGDWTAFGEADARLTDALKRALEASK